MKRTIMGIAAITAILLTSASVKAQSDAKANKTTWGVRAGVNFQNINGKNANGDKLDNKLLPGFNVGVNAEIPVAKDFYVQPGFPAHWDPKLRIPRGQVVAAASIVSPKY